MKNVNQEFDELMQDPTAYWVLDGDSRAYDLRQAGVTMTGEKDFTFQVGDKVEHVVIGDTGTVTECESKGMIRVKWSERCERIYFYHPDGRKESTDKYPSIRLIERPKKLVKKEAKVFACMRNFENYMSVVCNKKQDLNTIPVTISWEEEQ